jgi:exonuclease III
MKYQVKLYDNKRFMFSYKSFNTKYDAEDYFLSIGPKLKQYNGVAILERYKREEEYDKGRKTRVS